MYDEFACAFFDRFDDELDDALDEDDADCFDWSWPTLKCAENAPKPPPPPTLVDEELDFDLDFEFDDELDCEYDDALSTLVDGSRANGLTVVSSIE